MSGCSRCSDLNRHVERAQAFVVHIGHADAHAIAAGLESEFLLKADAVLEDAGVRRRVEIEPDDARGLRRVVRLIEGVVEREQEYEKLSVAVTGGIGGKVNAGWIDRGLHMNVGLLCIGQLNFSLEQKQSRLGRSRLERYVERLRGVLGGDLVGEGEVSSAIAESVAVGKHFNRNLPEFSIPVVIQRAIGERVIVRPVLDAAPQRASEIV